MANAYDRVVINPTREAVAEMLRAACDAANKGARTRTVLSASIVAKFAHLWDIDEAARWYDGGGVPNSYRQRAETTVVGFAWFTDRTGRRHVRVYSGRWDAPKGAFGNADTKAFGLTSTQFDRASIASLVYPVFQVALTTRKKDKGLVPSMLVACEENPLDVASWAALVDTLTDNGDYCNDGLRVTLAQARAALAAAQEVAVREVVAE